MALGSKQSLDFALNVPDASYVVVSAREQKLALVAPLYWLYKVILIRSLRHLSICGRQADVP